MISLDENFSAWTGSIILSVFTIISVNLIFNSVQSFTPTDKFDTSNVIEIIIPSERVEQTPITPKKRITKATRERVKEAPLERAKISDLAERDSKEAPLPPEQTITERVPIEQREVKIEGQYVKESVLTSSKIDTPVVAREVPPQPPKALAVTRPPEGSTQVKDPLSEYFQRLRDLIQQHKRYPDEAKRRGQEGTVVVRVRIAETGKIEKVEIVRGSGVLSLDRETLRVLRALGALPPPPIPKTLEFNLEVEYKLGA